METFQIFLEFTTLKWEPW